MDEALFWTGQVSNDAYVLGILGLSLLTIIPLFMRKDFYGTAFSSLLVGGEQLFFAEMQKKRRSGWLNTIAMIAVSLALSFVIIISLERNGVLASADPRDFFRLTGILSLGFLLLILIDRILFSFLGYIFIPRTGRTRWKHAYAVSIWVLPIGLILGLLLLSNERIANFALGYICLIVLLWRVYLGICSFREFRSISTDYLLFFLYLCSREVVPIVIILMVSLR